MGRLLLLEDDELMALATQIDLEAEGFEVAVVGTANEALDLLLREVFDGLVLDWVLHGSATGADIARFASARTSPTPCCIVTAALPEAVADDLYGLDIPMLEKPASARHILEALGLRPLGGAVPVLPVGALQVVGGAPSVPDDVLDLEGWRG